MRTGLIGEKLGHSFSKDIHELLQPYTYELIPLNNDEFHQFMKERKFDGINVTMPYKQLVFDYLDEIDDRAKRIGAVNCIVNKNGKLFGYNTDYQGIVYMLEKHKMNPRNKTIAILGSGGTSHTAYCVMEDLGAKQIYRVSRTKKDGCITYEELNEICDTIDAIVNTTPSGMYPSTDAQPLSVDSFKNISFLVDVIFNPLTTKLMQEAISLNIPCVGGLEMLVAQAVYASEYFHFTSYDKEMIHAIYKTLYTKKQNIVLIGMPTCGKSTIARKLSDLINKPFYDIDAIIEDRTKMSIPEIFSTYGEDYFRDLETQVTLEISSMSGVIISCGGGVIKRDCNKFALKLNGTILFIDRPLDMLIADDYRPLSNNTSKLTDLYNERYPIYCNWADTIIKNDDTIDACIHTIREVINL